VLQALIYLSDQDIDRVMTAVRGWCIEHNCEIDSSEGRRALTIAIDIVQSHGEQNSVVTELSERLAPCCDIELSRATRLGHSGA
jgi:hypothetical protein